jgi:phosphonate C-P lyase system protein PhnG
MTEQSMNGASNAAIKADLGADYTLCECDLEALQRLISELEPSYPVTVRRSPSVCLTMVPAEDSLEQQRFYLGEALTTECEVTVGGLPGYGLCLGDEPVRAYCLAVVDALLYSGRPVPDAVQEFLRAQAEIVARRDQDEFDLILQSQVDFKLMEEA